MSKQHLSISNVPSLPACSHLRV